MGVPAARGSGASGPQMGAFGPNVIVWGFFRGITFFAANCTAIRKPETSLTLGTRDVSEVVASDLPRGEWAPRFERKWVWHIATPRLLISIHCFTRRRNGHG